MRLCIESYEETCGSFAEKDFRMRYQWGKNKRFKNEKVLGIKKTMALRCDRLITLCLIGNGQNLRQGKSRDFSAAGEAMVLDCSAISRLRRRASMFVSCDSLTSLRYAARISFWRDNDMERCYSHEEKPRCKLLYSQ